MWSIQYQVGLPFLSFKTRGPNRSYDANMQHYFAYIERMGGTCSTILVLGYTLVLCKGRPANKG